MILATHYIEPSTYLLGGINFSQEIQPFEHASSTTIRKYSMSNPAMSVSTSNSNNSSEAGSPPAGGVVNRENTFKNTKRRGE